MVRTILKSLSISGKLVLFQIFEINFAVQICLINSVNSKPYFSLSHINSTIKAVWITMNPQTILRQLRM